MSCGVGRRCGLDLVLLWLWGWLAATAPIQPLAWALPYAMGAALKKKTNDKKRKKKETIHNLKENVAQYWFLTNHFPLYSAFPHLEISIIMQKRERETVYIL